MIVIDASVLANVLGDDGHDGRLVRNELRKAADIAAPDLIDVETVAVLRKRWIAATITERRFEAAIRDLETIDVGRYPVLPFMRRSFELRANVTALDATYVALAEVLGCELLTGDLRLAKTPGIRCPVRVIP